MRATSTTKILYERVINVRTFQCECEYLSIVTSHGELLCIAANSRGREYCSEVNATPSRKGELGWGERECTKVQAFRELRKRDRERRRRRERERERGGRDLDNLTTYMTLYYNIKSKETCYILDVHTWSWPSLSVVSGGNSLKFPSPPKLSHLITTVLVLPAKQ